MSYEGLGNLTLWDNCFGLRHSKLCPEPNYIHHSGVRFPPPATRIFMMECMSNHKKGKSGCERKTLWLFSMSISMFNFFLTGFGQGYGHSVCGVQLFRSAGFHGHGKVLQRLSKVNHLHHNRHKSSFSNQMKKINKCCRLWLMFTFHMISQSNYSIFCHEKKSHNPKQHHCYVYRSHRL